MTSSGEIGTGDPGERVLTFAGIHNFRDYGNYAVAGGRLRSGWLYRSAQHRDASAEDLAKIGALGLRAVVDLRGESERRAAPCPRPEGFSARVLFVCDETAGLAPHIEAARVATSPDEARASMRASYAGMPFRPRLLDVMRYYFEALATEDGPSLVHCAAGKDRTGLAVALFHALMGVHRDDILADYMLTNQAGNIEARIIAGARTVRRSYGRELSDAAVRVLMSVEPSYLDAAFAAIGDRHGSVAAYLADQVGVTPERREQIARRLIV